MVGGEGVLFLTFSQLLPVYCPSPSHTEQQGLEAGENSRVLVPLREDTPLSNLARSM